MDEDPRILYVQTHGIDEPSKAATPFYLATAAAAMDMDVSIYFTMHGPTLLRKDSRDMIVKEGGAPMSSFIDLAVESGVNLLICQPSLDLNDLAMEDLIDDVQMIGGAAFNDLAAEADAVISF